MVKSNHRMRFAPTPSGYLHAGNLHHLDELFYWKRQIGAEMVLRIDDLDLLRRREEYVQGIFDVMVLKGYSSEMGPRDAEELRLKWSQMYRIPLYFHLFSVLVNAGWVYRCGCSRKDIQQRVCSCGNEVLVLEEDGLLKSEGGRWNILPKWEVLAGVGFGFAQPEELPFVLKFRVAVMGDLVSEIRGMEDFVLWRRDLLPAYQLASLADDILLGITHVFRGDDLRESTQRQLLLNVALSKVWFGRTEERQGILQVFGEAAVKLGLKTQFTKDEIQSISVLENPFESNIEMMKLDLLGWNLGEFWVKNPFPNPLFRFEHVWFLHHPLILDEEGNKLSKSGFRGD